MQKSFAVKSYTLHLNRSAGDPLICCTIKLQTFRPLNALISAPGRSDRPSHSRGKGRRAARWRPGSDGRSKSAFCWTNKLQKGPVAERINCKRQRSTALNSQPASPEWLGATSAFSVPMNKIFHTP